MKYISPILLFFGVVTFGASVFIGYYLVPYKVKENILENSKIVEGTTRYNYWEEVPIPLFQHIYFFNVTNPDEVIQGRRPILQQLGPYVYQQKRKKFDIVFNPNGTIFYREKANFFFIPERSNGSETDPIITLNLPYVAAALKSKQLNALARYVIVHSLSNYPDEGLYMKTTIGELTFGGRYLPYLKDLSELNGEDILPNNTFGLMYGKNGSDQGRFEVFSGVDHPERFGDVVSWNGMTTLDWYEDDNCNKINGTDGGLFRPFATKETTFFMFIPGLCKSFRFEFDEDGIDVKGVPVYKYSLSPSFFQSAKTNPDNACYCAENMCPEDGVFSMEKCGRGAMMLSLPHFYRGSHLYLNQSIGLHPDKDRHEMALYIETYTSAAAKIKMRFQMNIQLQPLKFIRSLKKIPNMVHPIFWIDQHVEIPEEQASVLRDKLHGTIHITKLATHFGIVLGLVFIILSLLTFFLCGNRKPREEEGKVECVSYQAQGGTLPKDKLAFSSTNGKLPNGFAHSNDANAKHEEILDESNVTTPFLKQNGKAPHRHRSNGMSTTDSGIGHELIVTFFSDDEDHNCVVIDESSVDSQLSNSQSSSQHMDPVNEPDSRLSPFPVVSDYSSSLSVGDATNYINTRDIVETASSYENL